MISELQLPVPELAAEQTVSAISIVPDGAFALFVYAHGAGAPMRHAFMEASAHAFADRGIATLRFNFPYTEAGRRRPDRQPTLTTTIRAAVSAASHSSDLPIFAGGKSMGGRMTSHAGLAEKGVRGLVFVGYPLHAPGKPSTKRADNLETVGLPMLFLQGTRDRLADLELMRSVTSPLAAAALHVVDGADHGFHVLKRSGRSDDEVIFELAETTAGWMRATLS